MTQHPGDEAPSGRLPDLSGMRQRSSLPDYAADSQQRGPFDAPGPKSRSRGIVILVAVLGSAVVLLAILALVLSQTVFRSPGGDPTAAPTSPEERSEGSEGEGEYIPNNEDPDLAPPPPVFTQKPTTPCSVPDIAPAQRGSSGTIRGGDLEYTIPEGWDFPWGGSSLPYMTETDAQGREVESSWYSVVNLGRVTFPDSEGGYPGSQAAAEAIFQCYATTSGVVDYFGENPTVTDYRTEATTVDGYPAWIVQATYHFEDEKILETTSASVVTSIVVETPDGQSALASDVAADQPQHVADLEAIIASLKVVR